MKKILLAIPDDWLSAIDNLAEGLEIDGYKASRSSLLRLWIRHGLKKDGYKLLSEPPQKGAHPRESP